MGLFQSILSGGSVAERKNTKLWEKIKQEIMNEEIGGTNKGQWSARKAQIAVKRYKDAGGKYFGEKTSDNSLVRWDKQDWRTKSGKPSHVTGERYLPKKAIEHLTNKEYKRTSKLKREATKKGKQFSKQPKEIADKVRPYRE